MSTTPYFIPQSYNSPSANTNWSAILQAWLPVAFCACVFVVESQASMGVDHTSQPLHDFLRSILGPAIDHNWSQTHHLIRKTGHFLGYGLLSLACFRGFWLSLSSRLKAVRNPLTSQLCLHLLAIAATFCVASADEIHQSFLPNRTGLFSDVVLDTTGAALLQCLLFPILFIIAQQRVVQSPAPTVSIRRSIRAFRPVRRPMQRRIQRRNLLLTA